MIEQDILKASNLQNMLQLYDKNFNLQQEKKVLISARTNIPGLLLGSLEMKGLFSLFKNSERFISPILTLESDNDCKIKYYLLKNSAVIDINIPRENTFLKSIKYNITTDKTNTKLLKNKINFTLKKGYKLTLNSDSNEAYFHLTKSIKDFCRIKYKNNSKKKHILSALVNTCLFNSFLFYFSDIEVNLNKVSELGKNIQGVYINYQPTPLFLMNVLLGCSFNNFTLNHTTMGLFIRNYVSSSFKIENCFMLNTNNNTDKSNEYTFVTGFSFMNNFGLKFKFNKNEAKTYFTFKVRNMVLNAVLNYDSLYNLMLFKKDNHLKYNVNVSFKW